MHCSTKQHQQQVIGVHPDSSLTRPCRLYSSQPIHILQYSETPPDSGQPIHSWKIPHTLTLPSLSKKQRLRSFLTTTALALYVVRSAMPPDYPARPTLRSDASDWVVGWLERPSRNPRLHKEEEGKKGKKEQRWVEGPTTSKTALW